MIRKAALYLMIFMSELRVIAGLAARAGQMETGGDLWGLFSHGRQPRILLAGGPGPAATHELAHFAQDLDFCRKMSAKLETEYGIQLPGSWHDHHRLGLDRPSPGDQAQVRSITTRNGFKTWCEIITTIYSRGSTRGRLRGFRMLPGRQATDVTVRLNAFVYTDPQRGHGVRVPIRVLPGVSPIRQALLERDDIDSRLIGQHVANFPLDQMSFDSYRHPGEATAPARQLPGTLVDQIEVLPLAIQKELTVRFEDDAVFIGLSLDRTRALVVAFDAEDPTKVQTVYWQGEGSDQACDITRQILSGKDVVSLADVYRELQAVFPKARSGEYDAKDRANTRA